MVQFGILPVSYIVPYIEHINISQVDFENLNYGRVIGLLEYDRDFPVGTRIHCVFNDDVVAICEVKQSSLDYNESNYCTDAIKKKYLHPKRVLKVLIC